MAIYKCSIQVRDAKGDMMVMVYHLLDQDLNGDPVTLAAIESVAYGLAFELKDRQLIEGQITAVHLTSNIDISTLPNNTAPLSTADIQERVRITVTTEDETPKQWVIPTLDDSTMEGYIVNYSEWEDFIHMLDNQGLSAVGVPVICDYRGVPTKIGRYNRTRKVWKA
jgi:hypothetical protein